MAQYQEEPASSIVRLLGGVSTVATVVGKHVSRVYRWTYPTNVREGTGGIIPAKDQRALLEYARSEGVDLRPEDFFSADRIRSMLAAASEAAE